MATPDGGSDDLESLLQSLRNVPDFSAARANARLEVHEAKCDERQISMLAALQRLETGFAAIHARIDKVSGRMWVIVAGACSAAIAALGVIVFYLLTKAH